MLLIRALFLCLLFPTLLSAAPPVATSILVVMEVKKKTTEADARVLRDQLRDFSKSYHSGKKKVKRVRFKQGDKTRRYFAVRQFATREEAKRYLRDLRTHLDKPSRKLLKKGFFLSKEEYRTGRKSKRLQRRG